MSDERSKVQSAGDRQQILDREKEFLDRMEARGHLRQLWETASDALILVDGRGQIIAVNVQAGRFFGYPRDEMLGQSIEVLIPHRFNMRHVEHREEYIANPRPRPMGSGLELYGLHKDGREIPVEISLIPMETPEGLFVLAAIRDVTERKQAQERLRHYAEELQRSNFELQQFAYVASHDLQEPLRAIATFCEMLERRYRGKFDADADQWLAFVVERRAADAGAGARPAGLFAVGEPRPAAGAGGLRGNRAKGGGAPAIGHRRGRRRRHLGRSADRAGRRFATAPTFSEPHRQRRQISRTRAAAGPHLGDTRGRRLAFCRPRQRHRHRSEISRPHFRDLQAAARRRQISGHRHRAGHLPQNRRAARRPNLGRVGSRQRRHLLFYDPRARRSRTGARRRRIMSTNPCYGSPIEILLVEDSLSDIELTKFGLRAGKIANNLSVVRDGEEAMRFLRREGVLRSLRGRT